MIRSAPARAALAGVALALPFATLLSLLLLRIEPPFAAALRSAPDSPNYAGTLVVLGALALAVVGLAIRPVALLAGRAELRLSGATRSPSRAL